MFSYMIIMSIKLYYYFYQSNWIHFILKWEIEFPVANVFLQHCNNIVALLKNCNFLTLAQWYSNIALWLAHNIHTTFRQCCHNVVATLKITSFSMLSQHGWTLYGHCGLTKVPAFTMFYQHGKIKSFSMLSQHCYNIGVTHQESEI